MFKNTLKISICIPTYSRLEYLKESVLSAFSQTYFNIEVCVALDPKLEGPDKEIIEWCNLQQTIYSNIVFHVNPTNLGLSGNWNQLARMATGDFVIIIGDDDRMMPNAIQQFVDNIESGTDIIFSNHYVIDTNGNRVNDDFNLKYGRTSLKEGILENIEEVVWSNSVPMSSSLIKRELLLKSPFKEDLNTPEIEFFLKMVNQQKKFQFISESLVEYRIHPNSATSNGLKVHKLFDYLLKMPVSIEASDYKVNFLKKIAYPSINIWLFEEDRKKAKSIFFSKYYGFSKIFTLKGIVQIFLIILPINLSSFFLRIIRK